MKISRFSSACARNILVNCCAMMPQREMKNVTRIPPVADNGYGVSPVVGSQFRTHQIHPENVQSNAGLVAMLRNLKGKLDRRVVTVMLVDVGVFIRVIKVF